MELLARLVELNAAYARAIDNEQFEIWPDFFHDPCLYKVTTAENFARNYEAGVIYADSRGMLQDRVSALRQANIYERQRYRHIVGLPAVLSREADDACVETPFLVVRIMRGGAMDVFATGRYLDRIPINETRTLRFRERVVVCDGGRFDTLVALPL
jgi:3-phenylpropionate/cinnamic acid dioxygenase small subunit